MAAGHNPMFFRVTLLAFVVTVVYAVWQSGRIRDLQQQVNSAGANAAALEADLAAADEARRQLSTRLADVRRDPAVSEAVPGSPPGTVPRRPGRPFPGLDALMSDPEYQQAMLAQMRGGLDGRYASLFRKLQLSPTQLSQLKDLLVERQASTMDAFMAARSSGDVVPGSDAMQSLVEETQAEIDAGIRALLGDELYQQYEDYHANGSRYALADQLEQRLSYTATPLTAAQADELVRILAETQPAGAATAAGPRAALSFVAAEPLARAGGAGTANVVIGSAGAPPLTDEAIEQAAGILTPEQLGALREIQSEQLAQQKIFDAVRGSTGVFMREGSTSGPNVVPASPPGG